jgi:hypothetical protein
MNKIITPLYKALDNKKESLIREGNLFNYHFIDVNKKDYSELCADFIIDTDDMGIPSELLSLLEVDRVIKKNGLVFFVRYKDERISRNRRQYVLSVLNEVDPLDFNHCLSLLNEETKILERFWNNMVSDKDMEQTRLDIAKLGQEIDTLKQKIGK